MISERLGHATVAFTLQTYTHVIPGMDQTAADSVADLILARRPEWTHIWTQRSDQAEKKNWPGTKSQASGGSGGRI